MSTKKATKRALLTSILAICLCLVMLIGSTFAWFTDTASTSVNKIESGTLDLVVYYANNATGTEDGTEWKELTSGTPALNFLQKQENGAVAQSSTILWEPGCTYCLPALKIVNNGNLALKYKIQIAGAKDATPDNGKNDLALLNVITWTYKVNGETYALETEKSLGVKSETVPGYDTLTIEGHMQETAGNDYQGLSINGIAITVLATQDTVEYDSNSNQYDKNALYGDVEFKAADSQEELVDVISGDTEKPLAVQLGDGEYTLYNVNSAKTKNTTLTIMGAGAENTTFTAGDLTVTDASGEGSSDYSYEGSDVTFKNMTINVGTGNYKGFVRAKSLYFENCTIVGRGSYWGVGTVVFKNCTFASNANDYNIWTYAGMDFTFDNCVFNSEAGKFVNAYKEGATGTSKLNFTDCKFIGGTENKPAVCLKGYLNNAWDVTFSNCTLTNCATDATTGSNYYLLDQGVPAATTVTIDGTVVWENGAKK